MEDPSIDKIINKIEKLLRLAQSPNEHEASTALAAANRLLIDYNIEQSRIGQLSAFTPTVGHEDLDMQSTAVWKSVLLNVVCQGNLCSCLRLSGGRRISTVYRIIGRPVNIAATKKMFIWILFQIERLATNEINSRLIQPGARQRFRVDFALGATSRVRTRLKESVAAATAPHGSSGTALVLSTNAENERYMQTYNPQHTKSKVRIHSSAAYNAGYQRGSQISLGKEPALRGSRPTALP